MNQSLLPAIERHVPVDDFYVFPEAFTPSEVARIKAMRPVDTNQGTAGGVVDLGYRSSKIGWLAFDERSEWLFLKLQSLVNAANQRMWQCDLTEFGESIQYGTYSAKEAGKFDYHLDVGASVSNRKLSLSVLLSDPDHDYEGGQFQVLVGREPTNVELKQGSAVIFPSYLLHRVLPVTIGVRESLVTWVHGPAWK